MTTMDRTRSDDIRKRLKQEDLLETVLRMKKDWLKKIEDMPEERLAKTVEERPGIRPREAAEKMGR